MPRHLPRSPTPPGAHSFTGWATWATAMIAAASGFAAGNHIESSSSDTTLYTICCEGVFNAHPDVARSALVGVQGKEAMIPVLCVEPIRSLNRRDRDRIRGELIDRGAAYFPHQADLDHPVSSFVPGGHPP